MDKQRKIKYSSETGSLEIGESLSDNELKVINKIKSEILEPYGTTGIYKTLIQIQLFLSYIIQDRRQIILPSRELNF